LYSGSISKTGLGIIKREVPMKIVKTVMIALIVMFVPVAVFAMDMGFMRTSLIEGDVQIKTPESEEWGLASLNGPLAEGDQVWAPESARAELQLNSGTYVRLDHDSSLQILSLTGDSSQFYLAQGGAYVFYDSRSGNVMQIDTPDASVRVFDGAMFRIDISDRFTDVTVFKGNVTTENNAGETRVNAGRMLSLGRDTNGELAPIGPADDWEEWNNARNQRVLARRDGGIRYLPAELRPFAADLDDNGRWVRTPDYGYVWAPTVDVGAGWTPYRSGRWIWRGGDYVWVAHETWGWAPYHYGRWAFVASFGWCWVPPVSGDVYWSPGYVGWVRTPEYVAWVPLAPGEKYYGRGNYGRHSVNITNVNINRLNITNVYRNVHVDNGVTVVNLNSFNTGSPTIARVNRNIIQQRIFVRNNVSAGPPAIKPARGSYFASNRPVPPVKLPPLPIRNLRMRELKSSRPFIREPDRSVRGREGKARPLRVTTVEMPRASGRGSGMIHNMPPAAIGDQGMPAATGRRGERPQSPPAERRAPVTPGRTERSVERPQTRPSEKVQPVTPGAVPSKIERPQAQPVERRETVTPAWSGRQGERPKTKQPLERVQPVTPGAALPKVKRPQSLPAERREPATPGSPGRPYERTKTKQPLERVQPVTPGAALPRVERPQPRPAERMKPVLPGVVTPKVAPQVRPMERIEQAVPGRAVPKVVKPQVQPPKKGEPGAADGSGAREDKKPGEHDEGSPRSR
jgi:hypothetical protein